MKICIVGHFSENLMEGVRNVSKEIVKNLKNINYSVLKININFFLPLITIRRNNPLIIHFILSPTIGGLLSSKIISIFNPNSKIFISSIHCSIKPNFFLRYLKPDIMMVQSKETETLFQSFGYKTIFIPNGVDLNKFLPCDKSKKAEIRQEMNIPLDDFVILHLASLKKERNLSILEKIQKISNCQVIIIGRENDHSNPNIVKSLLDSGCRVIIKNFNNIEDIYQMSDCYVFPTINKIACIETPLSILEAMACNLPILTTKFGALPRMFTAGDGFYWIDDEEQIIDLINLLKNENSEIKTRKKVENFSWSSIIKQMCDLYENY